MFNHCVIHHAVVACQWGLREKKAEQKLAKLAIICYFKGK